MQCHGHLDYKTQRLCQEHLGRRNRIDAARSASLLARHVWHNPWWHNQTRDSAWLVLVRVICDLQKLRYSIGVLLWWGPVPWGKEDPWFVKAKSEVPTNTRVRDADTKGLFIPRLAATERSRRACCVGQRALLSYRGDRARQENECWLFPMHVGIYQRWPWWEKVFIYALNAERHTEREGEREKRDIPELLFPCVVVCYFRDLSQNTLSLWRRIILEISSEKWLSLNLSQQRDVQCFSQLWSGHLPGRDMALLALPDMRRLLAELKIKTRHFVFRKCRESTAL